MPNRLINSTARGSAVRLADCLSTVFVLELMAPSKQIYLQSPWISDVPLITNRFGQYRAIMPESGREYLGLAHVLTQLADRGTLIRIMCRPNQPGTEDFLRKLSPAVEYRTAETLHAKGLITDHCYLRGSMNFTYSGVNLNDEHIELTTDPDQVAWARTEAMQGWEGMGS